jgi:hypothetical protein
MEEEIMRKIVLIVTVLVVITGFVFAEDTTGIAISAWGRGLYIPLMGAGSTIQSTDIASWGGASRIYFSVQGKSPNAGFQVDINADGGAIAAGDQQKIWIKPMSMLTIQMGKLYDDTLRGSASYGAWNWVRYANMANGDDYVFTRVCSQNVDSSESNFEISLAPTDSLYFYGSVNHIIGANFNAGDSFGLGQYGAGYTIQGVGVLRAQFMGMSVNPTTYGLINAAFRLTAIQNLMIDLGCYIPTNNTAAGYAANIPAYVTYIMDPLSLYINGRVQLQTTGDTGFEAGLGGDFTLDKATNFGLTGDVRYQNKVLTGTFGSSNPTYDNGTISFLVGLTKTFSNGMVGLGFEGTTGNFVNTLTKSDPGSLAWAVPLKVEYWF